MANRDLAIEGDLDYLRKGSLRTVLLCIVVVLSFWYLILFHPINQIGAAGWGPVLLGGGSVVDLVAQDRSLT